MFFCRKQKPAEPEPAPYPRDSDAIATEMRQLLFKVNLLVREARLAETHVAFNVTTRKEGLPYPEGLPQIEATFTRRI